MAELGPWPSPSLVVEFDGDTPGTAGALVHDARRDSFLKAEGYRVLRFTNTGVLRNPEGVPAIVSGALVNSLPSVRSESHP